MMRPVRTRRDNVRLSGPFIDPGTRLKFAVSCLTDLSNEQPLQRTYYLRSTKNHSFI